MGIAEDIVVKVGQVVIIDGDILFFNDVALVYKDIGKKSIAIAPHRFPKEMKNRVKQTGIFNAGVIYLKRDKIGLKALNRWKKQCIKWCYWRLEDGKLGDQMYLNEWPTLYKNLHQFKHKGINLAPWNVNEYKLTKQNDEIIIDNQPLIFYHFHQFKIFTDFSFQESFGYQITQKAKDIIYKPYKDAVLKGINNISRINTDFNEGLDGKEEKYRAKNILLSKILPFYWKVKTRFTFNN